MKQIFLIVASVIMVLSSCTKKMSEAEATQLVENAKLEIEHHQRQLDSINDAVTGASCITPKERKKGEEKMKEAEEELQKAEKGLAKALRTYKEAVGKDYFATH